METGQSDQSVFVGEGIKAEQIISNTDWSHLAPDEVQHLFASLGVIIHVDIPMMILWGPSLLHFANDTYNKLLGKENTFSKEVGKPAADTWPGNWNTAQPLIKRLYDGTETSGLLKFTVHPLPQQPNQQLTLECSFSRINKPGGITAGILVVCQPLFSTDKSSNAVVSSYDNANQRNSQANTDLFLENDATSKPKESTPPLLALFEQSPVAIATIEAGADLIFSYANPFYAELVGRNSPTEIIGKPLLTALPEIEGQGFDKLFQKVISTGIPYIANEVSVDLKRGDTIDTVYVNLTYQPNRNDRGVIQGVLVVATDVTQQVHSRQQVEASDNRMKGLIAAAPAGIGLFVGRDLIIENPNQTFIDIVGKGPGIIGKPLREAMPELLTEGQPFLKILDDVYTTGVPFISPASLVKIVQNGVLNDNYYNISYTPLYDQAGEVYAILDIAIDVTLQVKAQQALTENEALLTLLRNAVPAMIFYLDKEQRYQSYNNVFMDWFQVSETAAIGKTALEFIGEAAYNIAYPHLMKAYAGEQEKYEMHAPTRMNKNRWLSIVYTPHKTAEGTVQGIIVHATDISQSKATELALRESEARFRALIEEAPVATCLYVGPELIVSIANEQMLGYWGKNSSIIGMPLAEAVPILKGQPFLDILANIYLAGDTYVANAEPAILEVNGQVRTFYFDYTYKPLRDESGDIYGIMNMAIDVTEKVMAKRKLEEQETSLRNAIELAELGTWSLEVETGVTHLSERHAAMFGLAEPQLPYEKAMAIVHPEDHTHINDALHKALQPDGDGKYEAEYHIINAHTGKVQLIHALGQTYYDKYRKPIRIAGTAQDITVERSTKMALEQEVQERTEELAASNEELQASNEELADSNEALIRSNEELAQYAYVASHDLQEPLRKIRVYTNIVANNSHLPASLLATVEKIGHSAERMSQLIHDLLEFSRLLKSDTLYQPINLKKIAEAVSIDFELTIREKDAVIHIEELPDIEAVHLQMNQLFYNLISNALKFASEERAPHIFITSEIVPEETLNKLPFKPLKGITYYQISLSDNGIGFESEYKERIFEVFKRLHGREVYPGSGIGLALCRRIIGNHHGYMYAESTAGKGSVFHIILPERQTRQ